MKGGWAFLVQQGENKKKKKSNKEQGMGPTVSQRNGEKLENK
jgi:hypothetical protein